MKRLPLAFGAYEGRSENLSVQNVYNGFIEPSSKEAYIKAAIVKRPGRGTTAFATMAAGDIRPGGLREFDGSLWVVASNKLYEVTTGGTVTERGTLSTSSGTVQMTDNGPATGGGQQLSITDGTSKYVYDNGAASFSTLSLPDSFSPNVCTFQDGYVLIDRPDSGRAYFSDLYDSSTFDSLNFFTAEGDPDDIVTLINDKRVLYILGENTYETYFNSGDADLPFTRYQGGFGEVGCAARFSLAKYNNAIIWLAKTVRGGYQFVISSGGAPQVASPNSLNYQLQQLSSVSDAYAFTFSWEGHEFYVCTFPTDNKTYVLDALTQQWFEWGTNGNEWEASAHAFFNGTHYIAVGDSLYELSSDEYADGATDITFEVTTQHTNNNETRIRISELQLVFEEGVGNASVASPEVTLDYSKDSGHTFLASPPTRQLGASGEYNQRAVFRKLGEARDWVFKITVTDAVKCIFSGVLARFHGDSQYG